MKKTLTLHTMFHGHPSESHYNWSEGGFLDFDQYALACVKGVLNAGATITAMEVC